MRAIILQGTKNNVRANVRYVHVQRGTSETIDFACILRFALRILCRCQTYYHYKGTILITLTTTMGKPKINKKKSAKKSSDQGGDLLYVNPSRIRYQHSRIRPTFSGCGRNVMDTLEEIRRGDLNPYDLPVIQVNDDEIAMCVCMGVMLSIADF